MRVLLATDAFPPVCGGSGWSTYELARGLRARGHDVLIVQPKPGTSPGVRTVEYDGLDRLTDAVSPMYGTTGTHYTYDVLDNLVHTIVVTQRFLHRSGR